MITKTESSLLALAVAMITLAIYQLWLPINYHQADQNILGELGFLENSAKLKISGDLVWRDARRGDPVTQGSSVFTGEQAQAVVSMNSGNSIQLGANTLIRINEKVILENGFVNTTLGAKPLELSIAGINYKLQGEGARLQLKQSNQATTLSVVEGVVKVESKNESFEINKDQGLEVNADSSKKIIFEISLVSPKMGEVFWTQNLKTINLEWGGLDEALLEISSDLNFKTKIYSGEISGTQFSKDLPAGAYFWRLSQADKSSMTGQFSIIQEKPIILIQPKNESILELAPDQKEFIQMFLWSDTKVAAYELLIDRNGVIESFNLNQTDFSLKLVQSGLIKWKVRPRDTTRLEAMESEWNSFTLQLSEKLKAPVWKIESLELSKGREDSSADVSFESDASEHEWILEKDGKLVASGRQVNREFSFPFQNEAGEFELKVRGFNKFGEASSWSLPLAIKWMPFKDRLPIEGQEIKLDRPDQKVNFQWQGEGEHYFELSQDESFSQIIISRKAQFATDIVFPEIGTYYWRVRKLDGTYSQAKKVMVEPSAPLQAPEAPPELKKEIKLEFQSKKKASIWDLIIAPAFAEEFKGKLTFSLPVNAKADGYKVEIFLDQDLQKLIFTTTTIKNEVEWDGAIAGQFWYRYALIDAWGRESEMSPASVLNIIPGQISAPERARLIRPIRAQVIEASPFITLAWTSAARTQNYILKISQSESFDENLFDLSINSNQYLLETKDLKAGVMYYWKIISRHQYGETSSNTGRFVYDKKLAQSPLAEIFPTEKLPRPLKAYGLAAVSWSPQSITTNINEKEFNADISGLLLNSLNFSFRYYLKEKWAMDVKLLNQSGKVFESQDYLNRQISLGGTYSIQNSMSLYHFSLGVVQNTSTRFTLLTPESVGGNNESAMTGSLGVEWEKRFEKIDSLHTSLNVQAGDVSEMSLNVFYRRFYRSEYFVQAGLNYSMLKVKTSTGSNDSASMGLSVGAGLAF